MIITGLKTFIVDIGDSNWVFVKIFTDEGITGLGEGTIGSKAATVARAIEDNERFIVGKDPLNIEGIWQFLYRHPRWRGGPVLCSALSAIDIALWDIKGKAFGQPIYQLLGGACRDRIRLYCHTGGETPHNAAERAMSLKAKGFTAMKTGPLHLPDNVVRIPASVDVGIAKLRAMRDALGDEVDILVDAHGQLTPVMALDFCRRVEEIRPMFVEEATQPEDLDTLAWLSQRVNVPLATGERLFTKFGFAELCARHLVNIIQPDIVHCGGISEIRKIAAIAEAHFIDVAPHNAQSWVSGMASLHVDACTPNHVIQEWPSGPPWQQELFIGTPVIRDGYAELPTSPGLGLDLNTEAAAARPYRDDFRTDLRWPDGSIADA